MLFVRTRDLTKLEDGIGEKLVQFMHFMAAFLGSLIMAFTKGWLLSLVCLSSFPVTMISVGIVGVVSIHSFQELVFKPNTCKTFVAFLVHSTCGFFLSKHKFSQIKWTIFHHFLLHPQVIMQEAVSYSRHCEYATDI
jgi:ABC-type multidrug transport system fused ATPase/permease subunit